MVGGRFHCRFLAAARFPGRVARTPGRLILPALLALVATPDALAIDWLRPREIDVTRVNVAPELVEATRDSQIERGKPRPVLDGTGWVFGIPSKIILWDSRVENHSVTKETEDSLRRYLDENSLDHVKVRINQYAPIEDWRRLRANKTVGWGYRYTLGALSVAGEAIFPGRLFGGDHYNPFTGTIHLYSDVPVIALHEAGHAKDFTRRKLPGTYALVTAIPFGKLWPEAIATGDVIAYSEEHEDLELQREGYRILFPAYGTYVGGSIGDVVAPLSLPIYAGAVVAGHAVGRMRAGLVRDDAGAEAAAGPREAEFPVLQAGHEEEAEQHAAGSAEEPSRKPTPWSLFRWRANSPWSGWPSGWRRYFSR